MRTTSKRAVAGAAALAVITGGLAFTTSSVANAAGTPTDGTAAISPASGPLGLVSILPNPQPAFCSGDSATNGYRAESFIGPFADDPNTYIFDGSGPTNATGFASNMFDQFGNPYSQETVAATSGQLGGFSNFDFSIFGGAVPPGDYNIGYVCTLAGVVTDSWFTPITITATGYSPLTVAAPAAPTAVVATPGNGSASVAFTGAGSSFTVTATPAVGPAITATGAASPITVPGLTNGTSYNITVTATNAGGTSAPSAPPVAVVPNTVLQVSGLTATSGAVAGQINLNWTAPTSATLTGYTLTVAPTGAGAPVGGSPFTVGLVSTFSVSGLTAGAEYSFTLLPTTSNATGETPVAFERAPHGLQRPGPPADDHGRASRGCPHPHAALRCEQCTAGDDSGRCVPGLPGDHRHCGLG